MQSLCSTWGALLREVVEDESCAFQACGEGKERVVIGGIWRDDPRRRGGQRGVIPPLRKGQHSGREGTYSEQQNRSHVWKFWIVHLI